MEETNEKAIYKLNLDYGRQGELTGLFIAKKSYVKALIENKIEVYFGEVLGKHSEVYCALEEKDFTFVSDNPEAIRIIEDLKLENGYNPFDYEAINTENNEMDNWSVNEVVEKLLNK